MRFGIALPHTEIEADPMALREWAQGVEGLGFHHIRLPDHVLGAGRDTRPDWTGLYDAATPFFEPLTTISFLAGVTTRLEFLSSILILAQRQTALVAKQAAMADIFCSGRMRLGVGIGWNEVEYEALGVDFHQRGRIYEEQIEVMRSLWTNKTVTVDLPFHRVSDAGLCPLPVQRPIPIWMGGGLDPSNAAPPNDKVLRRIARLADGWMPVCKPDDQAAEAFDTFFGHCREYGRDPRSVGIEASIRGAAATREEWADLVAAWSRLGATHMGFNTMGDGLRGPQAHLRRLEEIKDAAGPANFQQPGEGAR